MEAQVYDVTSMKACVQDAENHCIKQAGGGFVLHGTGYSTSLIPDSERSQFIRVIAEIIWYQRNVIKKSDAWKPSESPSQ